MNDPVWKRLGIFGGITLVLLVGISFFYIRDRNAAYLSLLMLTPAAGVILTRIFTREGIAELYLRPHVKQGFRYDLMAYFLPPFIAYAGAALYFLLFPSRWDPMGSAFALDLGAVSAGEYGKNLALLIPLAMLVNPLGGLLNTLGEEFAWRGYLLPKLCKKFSPLKAALLTNVIWGLWHAPVIATGYNYGAEHPVLGILAMVAFCVVIGGILSWLVMKTGSVWVAVIGHAALNGIDKYAPSFLFLSGQPNLFLGPNPVGIIGGIGFVVLAVLCYISLYRKGKGMVSFSGSR